MQGRQGQNGGFRSRCGGNVGTGHGNVSILVRSDFNLGVTHIPRQTGQPGQFQRFPEKRMARVRNGDPPLAFLLDERGIALGGVWCGPMPPSASWLRGWPAVDGS